MVEYAIISGKNFFGSFLSATGPAIYQIQGLAAKIGLNLSVAETFFLFAVLIAVITGLLVMFIIK